MNGFCFYYCFLHSQAYPGAIEACSAFTHVTARTFTEWLYHPLHRRLQPLRYLHVCSGCYWLERKLPGGIRTR